VEGIDGKATEVPLSVLFQHLPATVLKARVQDAPKSARKRGRSPARLA
jgi:hypothetical protein